MKNHQLYNSKCLEKDNVKKIREIIPLRLSDFHEISDEATKQNFKNARLIFEPFRSQKELQGSDESHATALVCLKN